MTNASGWKLYDIKIQIGRTIITAQRFAPTSQLAATLAQQAFQADTDRRVKVSQVVESVEC
jgi:hypothetical protein